MIHSDNSYEKNVYVQRRDAEMRAEYISDIHYNVQLAMPRGENTLYVETF